MMTHETINEWTRNEIEEEEKQTEINDNDLFNDAEVFDDDVKNSDDVEEHQKQTFMDFIMHHNPRTVLAITTSIMNHLLSKISLNIMAELGPSMWCSLYLIVSMLVPLILVLLVGYLLLCQLVLALTRIGVVDIRTTTTTSSNHHQHHHGVIKEGDNELDKNEIIVPIQQRQGDERRQRRQQYNCIKIRCHIELMATVSLLCWSFMIQDTSYYQEFSMLTFGIIFMIIVSVTYMCLWMLDNDETSEPVNVDCRSSITDKPRSRSTTTSSRRFFYRTAIPILIVTGIWFQWIKHTNYDLPILYHPSRQFNKEAIRPGLYYSNKNLLINEIIKYWSREFWIYDKSPWWILNGDMRTGLPFLLNSIERYNHIHFIRRWLALVDEEEAIALDFAFPLDGYIHLDQPIYVVLHGINGGSQEGYVLDFTSRALLSGSTVVVMNTRGLNGSPSILHSQNLLHFARISDIAHTVNVLRNIFGPNVFLGGVGYSMGAITLANYVARSGSDCELNGAVAISGSLNPTLQPFYQHSARIWQPMIVKALRDTLMSTPFLWNHIKSKLSTDDVKTIRKAKTMMEFDDAVFVKYHDEFQQSLEQYYNKMGAMSHITNVCIPLLTIHSMDDPIAYWKCNMVMSNSTNTTSYITETSLVDQVVQSSTGYVIQLWTQTGGHVGWPTTISSKSSSSGNNENASLLQFKLLDKFQLDGWKWMNDAAITFLVATQQASSNCCDVDG